MTKPQVEPLNSALNHMAHHGQERLRYTTLLTRGPSLRAVTMRGAGCKRWKTMHSMSQQSTSSPPSLPPFGAVTHRFRTSGTLSPPSAVRSLAGSGALHGGGSARPSTMGHHFQVDFFKSSLRILFTHVLLSSSCSICVIELLHRRERSHCLPREEEAERGRQLHFWPNLMSDNEIPYSLLMNRG